MLKKHVFELFFDINSKTLRFIIESMMSKNKVYKKQKKLFFLMF